MKFFYYYSMFTLTLAFAVSGYIGWLLFEPFQEPDVVQPFKVLNENKEVQRGGILYYEIEFRKYQEVPVSSTQNIICKDNNLVTLAPTHTNAPLGSHKTVAEIVIPNKTSLGECYVAFENIYHVNKLKDVTRQRETEWFTVTW